ncbi:hypothetical protein [Agromyces mediolanus]|uniref:hypothetical protein n=1 Tax=Agromyces mediolanus TaxID=41986 RepID=UPI001E42A662|nr:hypothetical protein [Agromyces mediolanus]MCD1570357.1 hypothetical protein [Agromyces mediolanus]
MHISETAFPHLVAAADERMVRELEQRRVAAERQAEAQSGQQPVADGAARPRRGWLRRHSARHPLGA